MQKEKRTFITMTQHLYKQDIIFICLSIFLIILQFINLQYPWFACIQTFITGIAGFILFLALISRIYKMYINHINKNPDYNFVFWYEVKIYKSVGVYRRNFPPKYRTYSEWKQYIETEYDSLINNVDFYHYLRRILRSSRSEKEIIMGMVIPTDIAIVTTYIAYAFNHNINNFYEMFISLSLLVVIFSIFITIKVSNVSNEVHFLNDFMQIVFPALSKKS